MRDGAGAGIARRDEILEVLYWLRGEGLHEEVRPRDLRPFLDLDSASVSGHLEALAAAGLVERRGGDVRGSGDPAYRLTETGASEAGRRFVESFAELLGQGHGTACAPDCDCQDPAHPDEHCPTHGSRHADGRAP